MNPTNLPDLYARVVAKRPKLAVPSEPESRWTLAVIPDGPGSGEWDWRRHESDRFVWALEPVSPYTAAALILARWVEALPVHHVLAQVLENKWEVYELGIGGDYQFSGRDYTATPLEALAAFYLGQESA